MINGCPCLSVQVTSFLNFKGREELGEPLELLVLGSLVKLKVYVTAFDYNGKRPDHDAAKDLQG